MRTNWSGFPACLAIVITGVFLCGCGSRQAGISGMTPAGFGGSTPTCWLTFHFKEYPATGDAMDVRVEFSSIALEGVQTYDWKYLAANAQVKKEGGIGRRKASVSGAEKPPLNSPFDVSFPMKLKQTVSGDSSDLVLQADLYWAGQKVDSSDAPIRFLYHKK